MTETKSKGGAPFGNQHAAKGRRWREALDKALKQYADAGIVDPQTGLFARAPVRMGEALDRIARNVVERAVIHQDRDCEEEIALRLDGKPAQPIIGDEDGAPLSFVGRIERVIVSATRQANDPQNANDPPTT